MRAPHILADGTVGIAILAAVFVRLGSLFQSVVYVAVNPRASKE